MKLTEQTKENVAAIKDNFVCRGGLKAPVLHMLDLLKINYSTCVCPNDETRKHVIN